MDSIGIAEILLSRRSGSCPGRRTTISSTNGLKSTNRVVQNRSQTDEENAGKITSVMTAAQLIRHCYC
jgi:hypothetical protein